MIRMSFLLNRALRHSLASTNILRMCRIRHSFTDTHKIPTAKHDRTAQCFTISLDATGNDNNAILRYTLTGDGEVHLLSTQVPESFRGRLKVQRHSLQRLPWTLLLRKS
ncbi:hypothetical protein ACEWY4_003419 [Coilia grayii]|uniref:Uncharacterized protein n=1 Tax=Coilia grayii TaxID=363190 RepID=A0ABD1KSC0_9TELE